jgi:hypothetical protein
MRHRRSQGQAKSVVERTRNATRPIMVEFVGAAGVGKSYWLGRLFQRCLGAGVAITNLDAARPEVGSAKLFSILLGSIWLAVKLRPASLQAFFVVWRKLSGLTLHSEVGVESAEVLVCSEGLFHQLRVVSRVAQCSDMLMIAEKVVGKIRLPDVVVVLEADAEAIYRRRVARKRPGDFFTMQSVEKDVAMTHDSLRTISHVRESFHSGMLCFQIAVDRRGAEEMIATVCDAIRERSMERSSSF